MTSPSLSTLSEAQLVRLLRGNGLTLRLSPFVFRIRSKIPMVSEGLAALYADYELVNDDEVFVDFHVAVDYVWRLNKRLSMFKLESLEPFTPLAAGEAFAFLEWGMNWCVTNYCHNWITVHSAVLERDGRILIMPAPPGSGKSTLCASLLLNGWRLLSDEMALLDPATGLVTPAPRPVSLKNQSIDIIRKLAPNAVMGPVAHDTKKGVVTHMRAPQASVQRASETGLPAWLIFPKYVANAQANLVPRGKAESLMSLAENSFNQSAHGKRGFMALSDLIDRSDCYDFSYGRLEDAIQVFAELPLPQ